MYNLHATAVTKDVWQYYTEIDFHHNDCFIVTDCVEAVTSMMDFNLVTNELHETVSKTAFWSAQY